MFETELVRNKNHQMLKKEKAKKQKRRVQAWKGSAKVREKAQILQNKCAHLNYLKYTVEQHHD